MKFTEHLAAHITPEWRKQYINYEVHSMLHSSFGCSFSGKGILNFHKYIVMTLMFA